MKSLKEKMTTGPVVGMTLLSCVPAFVEILGYWGFDFVFLDAEHTTIGVDRDMEKLIMAARLVGISSIVRVPAVDEVAIRKCLEMGADGITIPHIKTVAEVETCVRAARFPPKGRRGMDAGVRAGRYGAKGYNHEVYFKECEDNLIIPMAEDFEFTDDIDNILDVPGIDAINYGPSDYGMSVNRMTFYDMQHPENRRIEKLIIEKAHARGLKVMSPVIPPTMENFLYAKEVGVDMMVAGTDIMQFNKACAGIMEEAVKVVKSK